MTNDSTDSTGVSTDDRTDATPDAGAGDTDRWSSASRRTFLKGAATAGAVGLGLGAGAGSGAAGVPTPRLHTEGRWIRDPSGNDVKLRGMAPADPAFYRQYHPKSFEEVLEWATDTERGWHPNVVRLPCTQDSVDSLGLETYVTEVLRPAVDLLAARDVYALVDFHLIRPYTQEATETYNEENDDTLAPIDDVMTTFWERVAPEFADDEHVVYELFNEPTQPSMYGDDEGAWLAWRDAAQPWVDLVRDAAPETPIIIGSPRYTSVTHMAPEHPFEGENLIYAAHIYPANGAPSEFDQYYGEPANDVPVVVTEFGWDPSGGSVDQGTTSGWGEPFREWVAGYDNVGWISWCFDDSWAPTFFDSENAGANEPWTLRDGDEQMGGYIKGWLEETKDQDVPESTIDDDTAPPTPSGLSVTRATEISLELSWDAVTDEGEAGLSHYAVYLNGERDQTVAAGTTSATVSELSAETTYQIGVSAVDGAGNESGTATVDATTASGDDGDDDEDGDDGDETPPGALVVNDYDGDPGWSSNENDLGQWCGAGSFQNGNGEVEDGALVLAYDDGGWFQEQINRDVSEYSTLVFRVSGANGGEESEIQFEMGGVNAPLSDVTDDTIDTSASDVAVDLASADVDRTDSSLALRLSFWQGGSSTLSIEEVRLE